MNSVQQIETVAGILANARRILPNGEEGGETDLSLDDIHIIAEVIKANLEDLKPKAFGRKVNG